MPKKRTRFRRGQNCVTLVSEDPAQRRSLRGNTIFPMQGGTFMNDIILSTQNGEPVVSSRQSILVGGLPRPPKGAER